MNKRKLAMGLLLTLYSHISMSSEEAEIDNLMTIATLEIMYGKGNSLVLDRWIVKDSYYKENCWGLGLTSFIPKNHVKELVKAYKEETLNMFSEQRPKSLSEPEIAYLKEQTIKRLSKIPEQPKYVVSCYIINTSDNKSFGAYIDRIE